MGVLVFLGCVLFVSLANADSDVNPLLNEVIDQANQDAIKNHMDVIKLQPFSYNGYFFNLKVNGGHAGTFSTLELKGEDQFFNQTDGEDFSVFYYRLFVGLKEIKVQVDYEYSFLYIIRGSGVLDLSTNTDVLEVKGMITSHDSGACEAVLESAYVTDIGNFDIKFTPSGVGKSILTFISNMFANYILPHLKFVINKVVADIVKNDIPKSDFSKIVCKPLVV